jgi:hypothetical protein
VVDLSNSYGDLFELLHEEMPDQTSIMRVPRQETSFHFNPFRLDDPLAPVPDEQFELCMGLMKLMAGRQLMTPANEVSLRQGLAEFFKAYKILLRNGSNGAAIPPITLLSNILEMELKQRELSSAFQLWTTGGVAA